MALSLQINADFSILIVFIQTFEFLLDPALHGQARGKFLMQSNYKPNSTNGISLLFPSFKAKIDLQFKLVGSFFEFVQITYELLSLGGCNYYLVKVGRRKSREIHTSFLILSKAHWGHILTKEHSYFFNFYQISKHCFRKAQLF